VFRPGESLEIVTRNGQVWAYRRGEPLKGPAPDPYKDWDGGPELPSGTSPYTKVGRSHGQNDRGAKGE
jgi:hypothetical protein